MELLHEVLFVPSLACNLLSVGQLIASGLIVIFDDGHYVIQDKKFGQKIVKIGMTQNRMFPLEVSSIEKKVYVTKGISDSDLWHLCYGILHLKGLKLLNQKDMVLGLPNLMLLNSVKDVS